MENNKKKDILNTVNLLIVICIGIFISLGIGIALKSWGRFIKIFEQDKIEGILIVFLLISTISWASLYIFTIYNELLLLFSVFKVEKIPRIKSAVYFIGILMAIIFATLPGLSCYLLLYCIFVIIFEILDTWGATIVHRNIWIEYVEEIEKGDSKKDERKILADFY